MGGWAADYSWYRRLYRSPEKYRYRGARFGKPSIPGGQQRNSLHRLQEPTTAVRPADCRRCGEPNRDGHGAGPLLPRHRISAEGAEAGAASDAQVVGVLNDWKENVASRIFQNYREGGCGGFGDCRVSFHRAFNCLRQIVA